METKPIKTIELDNGLLLEIYDESREIAPARWLVRMAGRIRIPIQSINFPDGQNISEIIDLLGDAVVFEQKKERNFIAETEVDSVFSSICKEFLESTRTYLSHADFPRKFVFKLYRDRASKLRPLNSNPFGSKG